MSSQMGALLASGLEELRYEPIGKRIRVVLGGGTAVDSTRAVLVWEPRRIVPSYAVPAGDIRGELAPAAAAAGDTENTGVQMLACPGVPCSPRPILRRPHGRWSGDGYASARPGPPRCRVPLADPALAGYIVLDFRAFDGWCEEDEPTRPTRVIRSTASKCSPARGTSAWAGRCSPNRPGQCCCSRPSSRSATTCPARHPRRAEPE